MESLLLAVNVVTPLFLLMALGYILNLIKMVDGKSLSALNKLVFKVFLPVLLFYNVYRTDLASAVQPDLMLFAVAAVLIITAVLFVVVPLAERDNKKRSVIIQGIFRSNFVLFGIPVATAILGENNVGVTSVLIAVVVPVFNILAVITLEFFRGGRLTGEKVFKMLKGIVTNPLIISSLLGIVFLLLDIRLPGAVETTVDDLSKLATPLALIVLGGTFRFRRVSGNIVRLIIVTFAKLVIYPCIVIFIALKLGFRGAAIVSLLSMAASPTAVSSYTMAEEMGADGELAGQIVVFTTAVSIFTVFAFVFVLSMLGAF